VKWFRNKKKSNRFAQFLVQHLSNASDRGEQAANVIGDIVVKWMWS
jgi:hypothetical protein